MQETVAMPSAAAPPAGAPSSTPTPALDDPSLYLNREQSWLEFNRRVLEEARDPKVPLLERLKFLAIFDSNLDEFFMVRVGGLLQKVQAGIPYGSGADRAPAARPAPCRRSRRRPRPPPGEPSCEGRASP